MEEEKASANFFKINYLGKRDILKQQVPGDTFLF